MAGYVKEIEAGSILEDMMTNRVPELPDFLAKPSLGCSVVLEASTYPPSLELPGSPSLIQLLPISSFKVISPNIVLAHVIPSWCLLLSGPDQQR